MYPSRGTSAYGQQLYSEHQTYSGQQAYGQAVGGGYSVGSAAGVEAGAQHSRHSSLLVSSQEADAALHRSRPVIETHYGGQYASLYGGQQISAVGAGKESFSSTLQARSGYGEAPSLVSGSMASALGLPSSDYVSSSSKYGHKSDHFSNAIISDHGSVDRHHYSEQPISYGARDLLNEQSIRYADPVGPGHQHLTDTRDHMEKASLLRQQQIFNAPSLQVGSELRHTFSASTADVRPRPSDYLAARGSTIRHETQDVSTYRRVDADPQKLSHVDGGSYGGPHSSTILAASSRRNVDEILYAQGPSAGSYTVGLPPGRDYVAGKSFHSALESAYSGSVLLSGGHTGIGGSKIDERNDDRSVLKRELEIREQERRMEHAHMREREKERERARERERDRERERERERQRLLERREKERERERKRRSERRRERTPLPRISKDWHASSILKEERSLRRVSSLRHEILHRRRSPVREKRRDYVCKVQPFSLVEIERDYLSISRRYPRLTMSPEFSKANVYWPKGSTRLSFYTPVSFEHGCIEVETRSEKQPSGVLMGDPEKSESIDTVWNVKVLLMSGISKKSLEEICAEKSSDDRIIHFNNILRFAVLRKDRTFIAVGGPWNADIDGGNPVIDDSALIRTALRHTKDLIQVDLHNCHCWNRFLELQYDRVGKDGFFSHKEITVIFVPDLSNCLPSIELWQKQWHEFKAAKYQRELRSHPDGEKKLIDRKGSGKGEEFKNNSGTDNDMALDVKPEDSAMNIENNLKQGTESTDAHICCSGNSGQAEQTGKDFLDAHGMMVEAVGVGNEVVSVDQKAVKKKFLKKTFNMKGLSEIKINAEDQITPHKESKTGIEIAGEEAGKNDSEKIAALNGANTDVNDSRISTRKKIVKKVKRKVLQSDNKNAVNEKKTEGSASSEHRTEEGKGTVFSSGAVKDSAIRTGGKKKIVKRVIAKKRSANGSDKVIKTVHEAGVLEIPEEKVGSLENIAVVISKDGASDACGEVVIGDWEDDNTAKSGDNPKIDKSGAHNENVADCEKYSEVLKSCQDSKNGKTDETKRNDASEEFVQKSHKYPREKGKPEEVPHHPGFVLKARCTKESKLRSATLSLDSLLHYSNIDIEESAFEFSLFAESLYEMLQHQMGCLILEFLEKIRARFVKKKNQKKKERDEVREMGSDKYSSRRGVFDESSAKRSKLCDDTQVGSKDDQKGSGIILDGDGRELNKDPDMSNGTDEDSAEDHEDDDEDFEEDEEDDFVENEEDEEPDGDAEIDDDMSGEDTRNERRHEKHEANEEFDMWKGNGKDDKAGNKESEDITLEDATLNKHVLQAFQFFDRNRVGYIKVDDLRLILHNLGKFLSHRDVKELVQSALPESNTIRDNKIFYKKLLQ